MHKSILFLIAVTLVPPALAQEDFTSLDRFTALDRKYSKPLAPGNMGFVIKVFTSDRVIHQATYGMADLQSGMPSTETTNFNLASNSKQFTAGLALLLEQDGKLRTNDSVSKYIPEFPKQYAAVTVDQLIHHTAGLSEYWELCDGKTKVRNRDILDYLARKPLEFTPGSRFRYSNSAYVVLSEIVERLTGHSFTQVMNERVFKPLGMSNSFVRDEFTETQITQRAIGYDGVPGFEEDDISVCNYNYGDSSIYTSLTDYTKWLLAVSTNQLFSPSSRTKMFARGNTNSGAPVDYGYGWGVYNLRSGIPLYEHAGSWQGFRTIASFLPTKGIWVVALSNCSEFKEGDVAIPYLEAALGVPAGSL